MKDQVPWLRIFAEGAVIVLGILIALAADAWWDGRVERGDEQTALWQLVAEFEDNAAQLDSVIASHRRGQGAARVLFDVARGVEHPSSDSLRTLVSVIDGTRSYTPKRGALESLVSTANESFTKMAIENCAHGGGD